jgi:hypothetical protein
MAERKTKGLDMEKHRRYMRAYYKKNVERYAMNKRRFYKEHPDYTKEYYKKHKATIIKRASQWRKDNIEYIRRFRHAYYLKNKK